MLYSTVHVSLRQGHANTGSNVGSIKSRDRRVVREMTRLFICCRSRSFPSRYRPNAQKNEAIAHLFETELVIYLSVNPCCSITFCHGCPLRLPTSSLALPKSSTFPNGFVFRSLDNPRGSIRSNYQSKKEALPRPAPTTAKRF